MVNQINAAGQKFDAAAFAAAQRTSETINGGNPSNPDGIKLDNPVNYTGSISSRIGERVDGEGLASGVAQGMGIDQTDKPEGEAA